MRLCPHAGILALIGTLVVQAQDPSTENEINKLQRELKRITQEREKVRSSVGTDQSEFAEYQSRTAAQFSRLKNETDSLRQQAASQIRRRDSLGAVRGRLDVTAQEFDTRQARLRERLIALCDTLKAVSDSLVPLLSRPAVSAVDFVRSELVSNSIDNSEAMHRLVQIANDLDSRLLDVEIAEGPAPLPALGATASFLRIGGVFAAAIDGRALRCALWDGPAGGWRLVEDAELARQIQTAIGVREGKVLPRLVTVPFGPVPEVRK